MERSGLILPRINDKEILQQNSVKTRSRKEIVEEKIRRRRNELRIVCPSVNESRNILDIERKAIGALVDLPLVDWQINNRKSLDYLPDEALRLQQAKVEEWLLRNHFQVTRLPRLDPIILTSRGTDFSKYTNFVFPAPYCLRFKSKRNRHQKCSYEESVQDIRERCPRLLRTQRDNRDLFNLNPVVRVGGGYRRLSWKTAEILPSIGQTEKDVTSEFTCMTCGMNLAVTQEVADIENGSRFVVTYPNICANCGRPVNRRPKKIHNENRVVLPPIETAMYEDRDFDQRWSRDRTTGNPIDDEEENPSENDTGFSFTPEESVFITEADGSIIRLISKTPRDEYPHDNAMSRDKHHSSQGMDIIEHTDLKSGMRVRLRKRSSKIKKRDSEKSGDETGNDNDSHKDGEESRTNQVFNREDALGTLSSDLEGDSVYGKRSRGMTSHHRKPKRFYSIYYEERNAKSDSELQTPYNRYILERHVRRRKSASQEVQRDTQKIGHHLYGDEKSGDSVGELERGSRSSSLPVGGIVRSGSMDDIRKFDKSRSRNKRRRIQSAQQQNPSTKQRNTRKSRKKDNMKPKKWEKHRTQSGTLQSGRANRRNDSREKFNNQLEESDNDHAQDHPDGYTADSEEESLIKLQARLDQLKKMTREKSSGKRKSANEKGNFSPRKQTLDFDEEKLTKLPTSAKMAKASLASYGLDSDSWNSEESLHVRPISNEYSTSDEELPKYGKVRSFSFDISDLPSYRKMAGFHELSPRQRALTFYKRSIYSRQKTFMDLSRVGSEDGEDEVSFDLEKMDDVKFIGYQPVKQKDSSRKKYPRKVYKPVPLAKTDGRFQYRSKWNDDDLTKSDITLLTAQMQNSFTVKPNEISNSPDLICKGQSCFRCGTFVDECEAICTMCGTHCKQPPCNVCRDICERCGNPKVRCESRGQSRGNDTSEPEEMEDEGIGLNIECIDEEENEYGFGSGTVSPEASFYLEESSAVPLTAKKSRKPIKKKQKVGSSRGKQINRQRTSTLDSIETVLEEVSTIGASDAEELIGDDVIQDESLDEINDFTVAKPQKSKYIKSKKKFKSSRQVISQTVVYKNNTDVSLSRGTYFDEADEELTDENQSHGNESEEVEAQSVAQEEPQETQDVETKENNKAVQIEAEGANDSVKENDEKTVEKGKKVEDVQQEKPKVVHIPKPKLRGVQRVNAAYKERVELTRRLQAMLKEALSNVIAEADVRVRRDSTIDYLSQYRLVDRSKVEVYGRAFALEDEAENGIISYEQMLLALEGVPTIQGMSRQQLNYVLQVLEINNFSRISFKMFAVITALCEKVTSLDPFVREIMEGLDLTETEWKLDLYKNMFYVAGDRSVTFISPGDLRIELKAGGLNQQQEDHVIKHITQSSRNGQISFLDYMAYLPLFLSIHQNICSNALDMSRDKYTRRKAKVMA